MKGLSETKKKENGKGMTKNKKRMTITVFWNIILIYKYFMKWK